MLKKDLKGALETINANLEYMKKEARRRDEEENEAFKNLTTIVDQLVIKTESAVAAFSNHTKTNKPQTSTSPSSSCPPTASASAPPTSSPLPSSNKSEVKKSGYLTKPKVLLVTDSIGKKLELNTLERSKNIRIRSVKAYSSVDDKAARWPHCNVRDVVKAELGKAQLGDKYEHLLLSAPTVDITNINTSEFGPRDSTDALKKQITVSCQNMLNVAESALNENTGLRKVILMSHPPRFDKLNVDPMSLKPAMAKYANTTMSQLWLDSPLKNKILIGEHNMECSDEMKLRYDGVHIYDSAVGKKAYSRSVHAILGKALSAPPPTNHGTPSTNANREKAKHTGYPSYHKTVKDTNRFRVFNLNQGN